MGHVIGPALSSQLRKRCQGQENKYLVLSKFQLYPDFQNLIEFPNYISCLENGCPDFQNYTSAKEFPNYISTIEFEQ